MRQHRFSSGPMRIALLALIVLLAPACTLIDLEPEPLAIFDLRPAPVARAAVPAELSIVVAEPVALTPHSSERIAVRGADGALGVLAGARWAGSGPRLVQDLLLRGLEDAAAVRRVSRTGSDADCILGSDLRAFEYLQSDDRVRIEIHARLSCRLGDRKQTARTFEGSAPVEGRGAASVVAAFDAVLSELIPELVRWVPVSLASD